MEIWQAIILGIVQGITEWLPISSSGHLVLFENLLNITQPVIFNLVLHLGSLFVVCYVFFKDIKELIIGVFRREKEHLNFLLKLIIASIPIALVGFFLESQIKNVFNDVSTVGYGLLFTAGILLLSKYPKKKDKKLGFWHSLIIGFGQAVAILPGVSRSGITISTGMMLGIRKEKIATFAFLIFIPAIIGASIFEIGSVQTITDPLALIIGMLFTIVSGYISLKILLKTILKDKFFYFAIYCFIVAMVILILV